MAAMVTFLPTSGAFRLGEFEVFGQHLRDASGSS